MSLARTIAVGVAVALTSYAVPKYTWPILLEKARAEIREATAAPVVGTVTMDAPAGEEWTGVLLTPTVELTARIDAKLRSVDVRVGDEVHAGDSLAELDTTIQKHEIAAAEAAMRASRADAWQASIGVQQARERQARRGGTVKYGGRDLAVASSEELSSARFDAAAASGRASSATAMAEERAARVAQLRAIVEEATLRAPFDGTIAVRYFEPGAHVRSGMPLVRLVGRGAVRVRFAVPEGDAARVTLGARVVLAWDGRPREAVVDRIAPEVESASGTVFVEAAIDESDGKLDPTALSGRVIRVSLARGRARG